MPPESDTLSHCPHWFPNKPFYRICLALANSGPANPAYSLRQSQTPISQFLASPFPSWTAPQSYPWHSQNPPSSLWRGSRHPTHRKTKPSEPFLWPSETTPGCFSPTRRYTCSAVPAPLSRGRTFCTERRCNAPGGFCPSQADRRKEAQYADAVGKKK